VVRPVNNVAGASSCSPAHFAFPSISIEGRNCWRVARARRAALLVDAASYYAAFAAAVENATESILIAGWDFDSRINLVRDERQRALPTQLGALLKTLVARRRGLHVHVLGWNYVLIYALDREPFPIFNLDWRTHRRFHYFLDGYHPVGASHHQKIVVVDDAIAFVGGIDLAKSRWDTSKHDAQERRRVDPGGRPYAPSHDVQMAVDGEAAAALGDLVRERWCRVTAHRLRAPVTQSSDPWPSGLKPDLENIFVAIARTEPGYGVHPEVREVEKLYLDAIANARRSIYIENQYLTSPILSEALGARLKEEDGPDIIIVLPEKNSAWLEEITMGVLRARMLKRLRGADRFRRLRLYYPHVPGLGSDFIRVHAKVLVVDDRLVRVGSSNLNNRSMGLDTECDLAIESGGEARIEKVIAQFRNRLLGEHLGVAPQQVASVIDRKKSLALALDSLCGDERTLKPLDGTVAKWLDRWLPDSAVIDPKHPTVEKIIDDFVAEDDEVPQRRRLVQGVMILAILLSLAAAWRWTALAEWAAVDRLMGLAASFSDQPAAPYLMIASYLVGSLVMFPITLLILATAYAFGPLLGFACSLVGSLLAALLTYGIGFLLGHRTLQRIGGPRIGRLRRRVARHGLLAMILVHLVPVAPFTVVNMIAGASRIRVRDFALGTLIGMLPGIVATTLIEIQMENIIRNPGMGRLAWLLVLVTLMALATVWIHRRLKRGFGSRR